MSQYYSDTLDWALKLLYFQADPGKFSEGVKLLEEAVAKDEPDAYYFLARCYAWEDGNVKEDPGKARQLSKRGIELGSDLCVLGADRMGELDGDVKDAMTKPLLQSFEAVRQMAEDGEPMAQYAVGLFYFWGDMYMNFQIHTDLDFEQCRKENAMEALKWFRASAVQGCIPSFRNAFNSVREGVNDVPKDLKAAMEWMESVEEKLDLRDYYYSIALSYKELEYYTNMVKWAERGLRIQNSGCVLLLGQAYFNGTGVVPDYQRAKQLFEEAGPKRPEAWKYLGDMYDKGLGVQEDINQAIAYYQKAFQGGFKAAGQELSRYKKTLFGKYKRR